MLKKRLILGCLWMVGLLVAAETRPVVTIGIAAPITGNIAHIGENVVAWIKRTEGELAKKPTHYRYRLVLEDDRFVPSVTVSAVRRLVDLEGARVLLTYGSPAGVAASSFAESRRIPHLAIAYDPRAVVGEYTLSYVTPAAAHIPAFEALLKKKGYRRLAVFAVRNATWQPALEALRKAAQKGDFEITYEKIYAPGERAFRLGLQELPQEKVDAAVFLSWSPEVNILGRQYREQGIKKPIIGLCGGLVFSGEREIFEGDVDVLYADVTEANRINIQMTGKPVANAAGPTVYDEIMMTVGVCEGLHKPGELPSGEAIMQALRRVGSNEGVLGRAVLHPDKFFYFPVYY